MSLFKQTYSEAEHHSNVPLLSVLELNLKYNGTFALEDISFDLAAGERVAVVGPNGAGKSSLFKVIAGILSPSSGTVKVSGSQPHHHICIAYVPQRTQVDWSFPATASDVVMMGRAGKIGLFRRPRQQDWAFVQQCLAEVDMADYASHQIGELSGGQQQRVFIARALAQEAELMLMDEPLTGLDVTSQQAILHILDSLKKQNVAVMLATHDLNLAATQFEQVMLLNHRVYGFGSAQEALSSQNLIEVYGGHLHMVETDAGIIAIGDTHCEG